MSFIGRFTSSRGLSLNCRKEERDGVVIIRCSPIEKRDDIKQQLGERDIQIQVLENGKLDLKDDGGVPKPVMEELDEYLKRMVQ